MFSVQSLTKESLTELLTGRPIQSTEGIMTALTAANTGRLPAPRSILPATAKLRAAALTVSEQAGSLTFAKSPAVGVDATARIGDVGLSAATTKLTVSLDLKAGQKYTFSFWFTANAPKITVTDSLGKKKSVSMASGFTVAKSGTYQLSFEAGYSLKNSANFDNLAVNARSLLPTNSGDKKIDALLMGGTGQWWHAYDAVATKGTGKVTTSAVGLDANSSATALTYSFLTTPPSGQGMTGFQEMTAAQKNAVRSAFAYYAKLINVTFTEVAGDGTGNINFGTNSQASSAGYATLPNSSGDKDKAYLYLANNQATNGDAGLQEDGYGWLTVLHEIGHTLGLKHPGNYNAGGGGTPGPYLSAGEDDRQHTIMSYHDNNVSRGVNATTPMPYDVAALQYLYGANTGASTAAGGAFTFTSGSNYLQTLWSANGTDTIDLSQLTHASNVDLNAGAFSSINITASASSTFYSGNANVGLAYGSKINNVTLSSTNGVTESVTLNNAFASGAYDSIASFDATDDKINFKKAFFGALSAKNIEFGTTATKSTSKIVVNNSTGEIFFDADGSGKAVAKKIAQYTAVQGRGQLAASNFAFVA